MTEVCRGLKVKVITESVGTLLSQKFSNMRVTAGDTEASKPKDMPT